MVLPAVEILLRGKGIVFRTVISFLRPDVHDQTDCEEVKIRYRNPNLHAPQEKKRCR